MGNWNREDRELAQELLNTAAHNVSRETLAQGVRFMLRAVRDHQYQGVAQRYDLPGWTLGMIRREVQASPWISEYFRPGDFILYREGGDLPAGYAIAASLRGFSEVVILRGMISTPVNPIDRKIREV